MTIYDILKCIVMNEELLDKHEADFFFGEEEQAHAAVENSIKYIIVRKEAAINDGLTVTKLSGSLMY